MPVWELHSNGPGSRRGPVTAPEKCKVGVSKDVKSVSSCQGVLPVENTSSLILVQWHISIHFPFSPEVAKNPACKESIHQ